MKRTVAGILSDIQKLAGTVMADAEKADGGDKAAGGRVRAIIPELKELTKQIKTVSLGKE